MDDLTPQDFLTPETISLTDEENALKLQEGTFDFSYELPLTPEANTMSTGVPELTCTPTADLCPLPLLTMASYSSGSYTYTWARGVTVNSKNKITGGYYDANKTLSKKSDGNLCWAASASNLIAWWQNTYGVYDRIGTDVPTSASSIFKRFKSYWQNDGGYTRYACMWWLAGGSTYSSYNNFYGSTAKYPNSSTGGYYSSFYTTSSINNLITYTKATGSSSTIANNIANALNQGGGVALSIQRPEKDYGHVITLWGITQDRSGNLTAIHVTDSDDRKSGTFTIKVSYDAAEGKYRLLNYSSKTYRLEGFTTLGAFTRTQYSCPDSLRMFMSGQSAVLTWDGRCTGSTTYEIGYKLVGSSTYTYTTNSSEILTLTLPRDGTYEWTVRSIVGSSFTSDWSKSSTFVYDATPPVITHNAPTTKKSGKNKTKVSFKWSANEKSTYKLTINGTCIYTGTKTSRSYTYADGDYTYTLTATDAMGNTSTKSGSFTCDTGAVNAPAGLKVVVQEESNQATFSWNAVQNKYAITYELAYKKAGAKKYTYITGISGESYTLNLASEADYQWQIRAINASGNVSGWVTGSNYHNDFTAPVITLTTPKLKKSKQNKTKVTLKWSANEKSTYTLAINGVLYYSGSKTSRSYTLADGEYNYTLTATDAKGNTSTESGSFICETGALRFPPILTLLGYDSTPASEGKSTVTLNWECNKSATYTLVIDGETTYTTTSTYCTLPTTLTDGIHHYTLTATDAYGSTHSESSSFICDATAPGTLAAPSIQNTEWLGSGSIAVELIWSEMSDMSEFSYEVGYLYYSNKTGVSTSPTVQSLGNYTTTSAQLTVSGGEYGYVEFCVRAVDIYGNASEWETTERINLTAPDTTPPQITSLELETTKAGKDATTVNFNWSSDESFTIFTLYLDNEEVYYGSKKTYTHTSTLTDGTHSYTLFAEDLVGNISSASGSFLCDTIAPTPPANLRHQLSADGTQVLLTWDAATDADQNNITYDLHYRHNAKSTTIYDYEGTSCTINLEQEGEFTWGVLAIDGNCNLSDYVQGSTFTNSFNTAAIESGLNPSAATHQEPDTSTTSIICIDQELSLSAGTYATDNSDIILCGTAEDTNACSTLLETQETLAEKRQTALAAVLR